MYVFIYKKRWRFRYLILKRRLFVVLVTCKKWLINSMNYGKNVLNEELLVYTALAGKSIETFNIFLKY